ncbi:MAG TPA: type VI secretion system baseplate subunit TssE [Bryobacteraceae bacterium]|nr:type VI secretion system baseplate subunit TssE [Bryobacteraceae bacterium]
MPRWEPENVVGLSLLDRLIDDVPKDGVEQPMTRARSVKILKTSLRRDLEWLLNTRQTPEAVDGEFQELERSLYNYGLPDLTLLNWESTRDRNDLARMIEQVVATFEPRLRRIHVEPIGEIGPTKSTLRFQIEALLDMSPSPERISFDTVLQLSSGEIQVKGDPSAG